MRSQTWSPQNALRCLIFSWSGAVAVSIWALYLGAELIQQALRDISVSLPWVTILLLEYRVSIAIGGTAAAAGLGFLMLRGAWKRPGFVWLYAAAMSSMSAGATLWSVLIFSCFARMVNPRAGGF